MKTVRRVINKNLKMILIIAAVTVVALGVLLMLISGNEERNQIPTDPTQTAETTKPEDGQTAEPEEEETDPEPGVSKEAQKLFNAKAETLEDSAAVAQLLETIDLKKHIASYVVNLQFKEEPKSLNITFDKTVTKDKKNSFDQKVQAYAEQILALIADADEVQWTYYVKEEGKKKEEVTVYLNVKQATELLKNDVKAYGESEKMVQALLNQQKGQ